ncbi:MAG: diguanylate cyclase, partial [Cloacibacillus sp.]|nr:diguanylate cyclase [Cloacibacillus sp.]
MNAVNFNMLALLDELSELVYISDVDTYEMIFINESAKSLFSINTDVCGRKCYEVLQGRSSPCSFCTNAKLSHDKFYTWEIYNRKVSRHYLLKDKLISWNGREARLEIAFDITEKENQKDTLKNALDAEVAVLNCVKVLTEAESYSEAVSKVLENVGLFLAAERTYIFEIRDKLIDNTYEWCAPGVSPQIDNLQGLPVGLISFWRESFDAGQCFVITDIEELREARRDEYEILRAQKIRSLIAAPLVVDGRLIGYLGVDNPPAARILHLSPLLITLANFITGTMQRSLYQRRLEELSYNDMLTGLHNRNAFIRDVESLSKNGFESLGIIYVDVNGLKKYNDEYGHA